MRIAPLAGVRANREALGACLDDARRQGADRLAFLGDLVGRKYTFLVTILLIGVATFLTGILPTYASIGIWAPITLIALLVILGTRTCVGEEAFADWGWRVPCLVSIVLLGISVWIRMQLHESPALMAGLAIAVLTCFPLFKALTHYANPALETAQILRTDRRDARGDVPDQDGAAAAAGAQASKSAMGTLIVGFVVLAALVIFVMNRGGHVEMGGEHAGQEAMKGGEVHKTAPAK